MGNGVLYIIRGLPGSGKTTLARKLVPPELVFEADDYFTVGGQYNWNADLLPEAHKSCYRRVQSAMLVGRREVAVSNTFTRFWEYRDYLSLAREHNYAVQIIECHGPWDSVHGVPQEAMEWKRRQWQPTLLERSDGANQPGQPPHVAG